jgi:hypothetical protein
MPHRRRALMSRRGRISTQLVVWAGIAGAVIAVCWILLLAQGSTEYALPVSKALRVLAVLSFPALYLSYLLHMELLFTLPLLNGAIYSSAALVLKWCLRRTTSG